MNSPNPNRMQNASGNNPVISLERGKLPPQAVDLERVVLGAMLIDKKGVDEVIDILHKDAFYVEAHQHIFEAILQLFESSEPIDLLTVSSKLRKNQKHDNNDCYNSNDITIINKNLNHNYNNDDHV